MKNKILIFLILSAFYSCGTDKQSENRPDLSKANRIVLDYKTDFDSTGKINIKSTEIRDLKKIADIRNTVTYDPFTYIYCVSSGSMSFYNDSTLIVTMVYNTLPEFRHIAFTYNGELMAMSLTGENAKLISNLQN